MRHRKSGRKLKRTASHRKATLSALSTALLRYKIITRAKNAMAAEGARQDVHARRQVARSIKDKAVVKELFGEIAQKVAQRPGGYTRVIKLGQRFGDGAEVAILELVDYNTGQVEEKPAKGKPKKAKSEKKPRSSSAIAGGMEVPAPAEQRRK
jgi:large subunit ribosomal protein L17